MRGRAAGFWGAASFVLVVSGAASACGLDQNGAADLGDDASTIPPGDGGGGVDAIANGDGSVGTDGAIGTDAPASDSPGDDGPLTDGPPADGCGTTESSCLDGIDNDCNGHVDCDDPACGAYACVPPAPVGFTGYAIHSDNRSSACPSTFPTQQDLFEQLTFAPAACHSCSCMGIVSCGASGMSCSDNSLCLANVTETSSVSSSCAALATTFNIDSTTYCSALVPTATGSMCQAAGGQPNNQPPTFSKLTRVCTTAQAGGGCTGGKVCAPKPPGGSNGVCIMQPVTNGTATCPAGYTHGHVASTTATSYTDGRTCTACNCSTPLTGAACSASVTLYTDTGCSPAGTDAGAPLTLAADNQCHNNLITQSTQFVGGKASIAVANYGSCPVAPGSGQGQGTVVQTDEVLTCCQN